MTHRPVLTDAAKRAAFVAVIALQDQGYTVSASRAAVAGKFLVTPDVVRQVEREGITKQWPPLGPEDHR